MKYHFRVTKEKRGFSAECIELEGCRTQADSKVDLERNLSEALNLYLSEPANSSLIFPGPRKRRPADSIAIKVSPTVAFAMALRQARVKRKMTQSKAAKLLGYANISAYQKLETRSANPKIDTVDKIKSVFPEISIDALVG